MTDDELLRRVRAADPARRSTPPDAWVPDLVEATMNRQSRPSRSTWQQHSPDRPPAPRRTPPWTLAAAAAVAVAGIGAVALTVGDEPDVASPPAQVAMTLDLPDGTTATSCLPFEERYLADMAVAFDATAVDVDREAGEVLLEVERWFAGGTGDLVRVDDPGTRQTSLSGELSFDEGERYLVTASQGQVTLCGYSAAWSPELARSFERAFGA